MKEKLIDLVGVIGACLLIYGLWLFSTIVCLIITGMMLMGYAMTVSRGFLPKHKKGCR